MKHARVVHRLSRRLRLVAPVLVKQPERCYILEILLRKHGAVKDVRAVPQIGSVTLHFDPAQASEERLLAVVDAVIGNIAAAPAQGGRGVGRRLVVQGMGPGKAGR